jgi:hypothetical protein
MALTGGPGPRRLGPPDGLVPKLQAAAALLRTRSGELGGTIDIDPLVLLGERASHLRFGPQGTTSCGGATRLLRATDGWFAISLAREDDLDLIPAWLQLDADPVDTWATVAAAAAGRPAAELVDRAVLLGLPVGLLPPRGPARSGTALPVARVLLGEPMAPKPLADVVIADLSSLWAGPLCGSLLASAGATVLKVESTGRPDGARLGPAGFFGLLNGRKRERRVDLQTERGVAELRSLLEQADVVIEASRPRALEQLGIDAEALVRGGGPRVWASITGHGRATGRDRVAFGDDGAVAGGLVAWDGDEPVFCADAVADPTTGLVAAAAIVDALAGGAPCLLDIAMAEVARHLAGPTLPHALAAAEIAPPRTRPA